MCDKIDLDIDVAHFVHVEERVLASLRVGQRLTVTRDGEGEKVFLCTEAGAKLAPLLGNLVAASCLNSKVIIRVIKRDSTSGAVQKFQVRVYRGEVTVAVGDPNGQPLPMAGYVNSTMPSETLATGMGQVEFTAEECDYKLRRGQYQTLADNGELRAMLADPYLQAVLLKIDNAPDRERGLASQLETPNFQDFVSKVLMSLNPERVPATAATAAAVEMAMR